jgi:hypothetical protein
MGEWRYSSIILDLITRRLEWSATRPGCFTPRDRRLGGLLSQSGWYGEEINLLPLLGICRSALMRIAYLSKIYYPTSFRALYLKFVVGGASQKHDPY